MTGTGLRPEYDITYPYRSITKSLDIDHIVKELLRRHTDFGGEWGDEDWGEEHSDWGSEGSGGPPAPPGDLGPPPPPGGMTPSPPGSYAGDAPPPPGGSDEEGGGPPPPPKQSRGSIFSQARKSVIQAIDGPKKKKQKYSEDTELYKVLPTKNEVDRSVSGSAGGFLGGSAQDLQVLGIVSWSGANVKEIGYKSFAWAEGICEGDELGMIAGDRLASTQNPGVQIQTACSALKDKKNPLDLRFIRQVVLCRVEVRYAKNVPRVDFELTGNRLMGGFVADKNAPGCSFGPGEVVLGFKKVEGEGEGGVQPPSDEEDPNKPQDNTGSG